MDSRDKRISAIERDLSAVERDVAHLARGLTELSHQTQQGFDDVHKSLENISTNLSQKSETKWGILGTWGAVLLAIIGGVGTLTLIPVREHIHNLNMRLHAHEQIDGHNGAMILHSSHKERFDRAFDSIEQNVKGLEDLHDYVEERFKTAREFSQLLNDNQAQQLAKSDRELRTETELIIERVDTELKQIREMIKELKEKQ